ncbi:hypothetical protein [Luteipulveratus halotolerans]|uniref:Uncharacterized protein n=1 Tax=Luteipulveratus halotolerans TaxID=1631356 RepID=A0A0L6CJQ0_9MICO|nr:hypothetical protein [Luteipulveratus halotolerans]KNX37748.1 hypothetical protein VV01_12270 [Luteipulveratus halotolerans]
MTLSRRRFLALSGGVALAATLATPPADAARPLRVLVATNEPWGTYHLKPLLDEAARARRWQIALVAPDLSRVAPGDPVPVVPLADAARWGADLLVVNGATAWPTQVVGALSGLPVVASSLAYLQAVEQPGAASIRPRLVGLTAGSSAEATVFAAHFGVSPRSVAVVGNPALDDLPSYAPVDRTALVVTSVTKSSETGGSAPGAQLLLDSAAALAARGWHVRVGLHPREDRTLWEAYEIAPEGTLLASATAQVAVGIPGSVFPQIAAVGAPLVGVLAPGLTVPDYILALCAHARTVAEVETAVRERERPDADVLEAAIGPVGGSGERLWKAWRKAALRPGKAA